MGRRLKLQTLLETVLGSSNVYFQPPENLKMKYPAIVYTKDDVDTRYADNVPYSHETRWQVTIIDRNPDSDIPDRVASLPKSSFVRFFVADTLNHDIYSLYF